MEVRNNLISIVTPSYNQQSYIAETIESVISQAGDFLIDYVIIDGQSKDRSLEVIEEYQRRLDRECDRKEIGGLDFYIPRTKKDIVKCNGVSYRYVSERDDSHADALNKGFKMTKGDIMAWQNSDDKYHEGAFQAVAEIFGSHKTVDWIVGKYSWWDKEGNCYRESLEFRNVIDILCFNFGIQQESTFWRRALWERAGGYIDQSYKYIVDVELWTRFFCYADIYQVDRKLSGYRFQGKNRAHVNRAEVEREKVRAVKSLRAKFSLPVSYHLLSRSGENWQMTEVTEFKVKEIKGRLAELEKKQRSLKRSLVWKMKGSVYAIVARGRRSLRFLLGSAGS